MSGGELWVDSRRTPVAWLSEDFMTRTLDSDIVIPADIARAAVMPESYRDEEHVTYPAFAWLRANNPLGQARLDGFDPIWLVTKYEDLKTIEREPLVFPSGVENPILNDRASDGFIRSMCNGTIRSLDTITYMDPPEHGDVRGIANEWFMPRNVRTFEAQIRELARDQVASLRRFDGEFDFVKDFALYYPLHVIMTLFGVPEEDEPAMLKLTQEFFGANDPEEQRAEVATEPDVAARMWTAAVQGFYDYFDAKIADRRQNPTGDLLSLIANSKVRGEYGWNSRPTGW